MIRFRRKNSFSNWCMILQFHQQCLRYPVPLHLLQHLIWLLNFCHSSKYKMLSLCGLDLYFSDHQVIWISLHLFIGCMCFFFCELPIHIFRIPLGYLCSSYWLVQVFYLFFILNPVSWLKVTWLKTSPSPLRFIEFNDCNSLTE